MIHTYGQRPPFLTSLCGLVEVRRGVIAWQSTCEIKKASFLCIRSRARSRYVASAPASMLLDGRTADGGWREQWDPRLMDFLSMVLLAPQPPHCVFRGGIGGRN